MTTEAPNVRQRSQLFDSAAELYRDGRPGYPDEVYALLQQVCGLKAGSHVLEIGAGAGQATLPLLQLGAQVTAVEPGPALTEVLRQRAAGLPLTVVTATFEEAPIASAAFDLAVAATSFHWVDPGVGLPKLASALRAQGWLALWWTVFGDPTRPDPFHEALQPILRRLAPHLISEMPVRLPDAADRSASVQAVKASGLFTELQHQVVSWEGRHDPAQLRTLFATFSPWIALPEGQRVELLDAVARLAQEEFGGLVVRPYQTFVYLAQRLTN
jgi:SAM-dependent methyltransferase